MTEPHTTNCPLCNSVQSPEVLVCTVCNRDIAIPASLKAEHEDLLQKRELLRDRISAAEARIKAIRSKGR